MISVCLCTRDRVGMLERAMASLLRQELEPPLEYEVVVLDDGSTDGTPAFLDEVAAAHPRVRVFTGGGDGIAKARNRTVREAAGEWLAFIDDDEEAGEDWLAELHRTSNDADVRCVGGPCHVRIGGRYRTQSVGTVHKLFGHTTRPSHNYTPGAGNAFVHRQVFEVVGLFDEALDRGEDTDFFRRATSAGFRTAFAPTAPVLHFIPEGRVEAGRLTTLAAEGGARRAAKDLDTLSTPRMVSLATSRLLYAVLYKMPARALHGLAGREWEALNAGCSVAFNQSYVREVVRRAVRGRRAP